MIFVCLTECLSTAAVSHVISGLRGGLLILQITHVPTVGDHYERDDSGQRQDENDGHEEENVQRPMSALPKSLDVCVALGCHSDVPFFFFFQVSGVLNRRPDLLSKVIQTASALQPRREASLVRTAGSMTGFYSHK